MDRGRSTPPAEQQARTTNGSNNRTRVGSGGGDGSDPHRDSDDHNDDGNGQGRWASQGQRARDGSRQPVIDRGGTFNNNPSRVSTNVNNYNPRPFMQLPKLPTLKSTDFRWGGDTGLLAFYIRKFRANFALYRDFCALTFLKTCMPSPRYVRQVESCATLDDALELLSIWCSDSHIHTLKV